MKRLLATIALIAFVPALIINAQQLTPAQKRNMLYAAWNLVSDYETECTVFDEETANRFKRLFENSNTKIYNDILGYSYENTLSLSDYVYILLEKIYPGTCYVVLKNINHGEPEYEASDLWTMEITFQKEVSYYDNCNEVNYASVEYYSDPKNGKSGDYFITMKIVWNSVTGECKIRSLDGYVDSDKPSLPEGFMIFDVNKVYFKNKEVQNVIVNSFLLYKEKPLTYYMDSSYVFITKEDYLAKRIPFRFTLDDNYSLNFVNYECNLLGMNYTPHRWRLRPHYEQNIVKGAYDLKAADNVSLSSSGFEAGIDFGYIFPTLNNTKKGFFFGIGVASNTLDSKIASMKYSYDAKAAADIDGDTYRRFYEIYDISYKTDFLDLVVPIYFDFDKHMGGYLSFYMDLGVKLYYNIKQETTDFGARYNAWGVYPQYGNLLLNYELLHNQGTGMNGFVKDAKIENIQNLSNLSFGLKPFSLDAFGGVGFRFRLAKRSVFLKNLYFDVGATYQYSTLSFYSNDSQKSVLVNSTNKKSNENEVMMSYTVKDGENVSNISDYIEGFSRSNTFRLKCSLLYRF